jgi:hypothetical protein
VNVTSGSSPPKRQVLKHHKESLSGTHLILYQLLLPMRAYRLRGRGLRLVTRWRRIMSEGVLVVVVGHRLHVGMLHDSTVCVHGVSWRCRRLGLGINPDAKMSVPGVCLVMVCWQLLGHSR